MQVHAVFPQQHKLQHVLSNYQIKSFSAQGTCGLVFSGAPASSVIFLYNNNHYDVITKPIGFIDNIFYFKIRNVTHTNKDMHHCSSVCQCCFESPECINLQFMDLNACNYRFFAARLFLLIIKHTV